MASLTEAKPVLHVPFVKYDIWLVDFRGAPFVPLRPICDVLGLNFNRQVSRLRHSKEPYGIRSVAATEEGKIMHLDAIPLENLSAFLFTLKSVLHLVFLRNFKKSAARSLVFFWSRYQREYVSPKTVAAELATITRLLQIQNGTQPASPVKKPPQITPDTVVKIKAAKASGKNITQVARQMGLSRTAVSLILSEKYKTKASGTAIRP